MVPLGAHTPEDVLAVVATGHLEVRLQPQVVPEDVLLAVLRHQPALEAFLAAHKVVHLVDGAVGVRARYEEPLDHGGQRRAERLLLWTLLGRTVVDFLPVEGGE